MYVAWIEMQSVVVASQGFFGFSLRLKRDTFVYPGIRIPRIAKNRLLVTGDRLFDVSQAFQNDAFVRPEPLRFRFKLQAFFVAGQGIARSAGAEESDAFIEVGCHEIRIQA